MSTIPARTMLKDSLAILALGVIIGLAANALSPRGLSLRRDYFAAAANPGLPAKSAATPALPAGSSMPPAAAAHSKRGLPLASHDQVLAWFHDPRYAEQEIIFIDARDDDHYAAGHIPGAYQFDHYHPERYLTAVLAVSRVADLIVVYCNGGDCDDSELAALDLISLGVPASKLVIYGGGITEWTKHNLPEHKGASRP